MDINNMKVTDLKRELKARGLSIVGNKSELTTRLADALQETDVKSADDHIEDSVLEEDHNEEELLGEDLANESLTKADEHLIEDLLNNKTKTTINVKKELSITTSIEDKSKASVTSTPTDGNSTEDSITGAKPTVLKTTNAIKLSANEAKVLRAQKFGDKLTERAKRFGVNTPAADPKTQSNNNSGSVDEKLKVRAQRFGAVVSEKMKKIEDNEKLMKRKERFGVNTNTNNNTNPTQTLGPIKRKITALATTEVRVGAESEQKMTLSFALKDRKQQRLARFGSLA